MRGCPLASQLLDHGLVAAACVVLCRGIRALSLACRWQGTERARLSLCFWGTASLMLAPLHGFLVQSYQWWTSRPYRCPACLVSPFALALALRPSVLVWLAGARLHAGRIAGPHAFDDAAWIAAVVHHPVLAASHLSRFYLATPQSVVHRTLDIGS